MLRKLLKIALALVVLIIAYLVVINWSIYHRIDAAGLKASDNQHRYIFNDQATTSSGLIYVALGDSLTAGIGVSDYKQSYPYLVAEKMAGTSTKVTHLNYSYPGAKESNLIEDLLAPAITDQPDVITLLIGINDVHSNISRVKFKQDYEKILTELKTKTGAKINVISLPFTGADSLLWPPFNYYYHARTIKFNEIIEELATANNLNYIDLTTPTAPYTSKTSDYYAADNFHPGAAGYKYWSQIIYDHLDK